MPGCRSRSCAPWWRRSDSTAWRWRSAGSTGAASGATRFRVTVDGAPAEASDQHRTGHAHAHDGGQAHEDGRAHEHGRAGGHAHAHDGGQAHEDGRAHEHGHAGGHAHAHDGGQAHEDSRVHEHSHAHARERGGRTHGHRSLSAITAIVERSGLSAPARARAVALFTRLAEIEADIHQVPVEEVHLHEVGGVDSIVDIVGAVFALEWLAPDRIVASPLNVGSGTVRCEHGELPVPAPATVRLVEGAPIYSSGPPVERLTPTGALLVTGYATAYGGVPPMTVRAVGYGAGAARPPRHSQRLARADRQRRRGAGGRRRRAGGGHRVRDRRHEPAESMACSWIGCGPREPSMPSTRRYR